MAALRAALPNAFFQWPNNATLTLIRRRRIHQGEFARTSTRNQRALWIAIRNEVRAAHPNFAPTTDQCRNKWNSLTSGYRNLEILLANNPYNYPTHTPTLHDERFHNELSDVFWLTERNYLLLNFY